MAVNKAKMDAVSTLKEDVSGYTTRHYSAIAEQIIKIPTSVISSPTDFSKYNQTPRARTLRITEIIVQLLSFAAMAFYICFVVHPRCLREIRKLHNIESRSAPVRKMKLKEVMSYFITGLVVIELLILALPSYL
ncbi:hypothetical protein BKA64DRAFT_642076 [Cadophora sp. MPI-SDFR-AT-0126]|nr:hypothetical protein BKA64DRAFT_642076 [Leotiomycetes sp. MPI-SDFR-AT-0126]